MKKFFIFIILVVTFIIWFDDWTSSGKMDAFLEQHENSDITPRVLFLIGEACYMVQETKAASQYYRWAIDKYPEETFIPRVRFHLGRSYDELGDRGKAMEQYVVLKDSFSETDYGRMAKRKWEISRY